MKQDESEDLVQYISLAQHVVGNIIQYCSFVKEIDRSFEDLPILDYFTNGETFPQPGSNEISYAAQRLQGIARKDTHHPFSNATQMEVFWNIKSFLEKCVQNAREEDFVKFVVLALCESDETVGNHVGLLRNFAIRDIFCEYLGIAREAPDTGNPAFGYIIPWLRAVREIYSCVWQFVDGANVATLKNLMFDLLVLVVAMYNLAELLAGQVERFQQEFYSVVWCRILDFIIFVDHVVFYSEQIFLLRGISPRISLANPLEEIDRMRRLTGLFRRLVEGLEPTPNEREWVESLLAGIPRNNYMRTTVRREMRSLQLPVAEISPKKMKEISRLLVGEAMRSPLDEEIAGMYI